MEYPVESQVKRLKIGDVVKHKYTGNEGKITKIVRESPRFVKVFYFKDKNEDPPLTYEESENSLELLKGGYRRRKKNTKRKHRKLRRKTRR